MEAETKTTNKYQMDTLLGLMQTHRDIALSCNQRKKEDVIQFWKKVQQQLNAAGPPFKCISEWRKVWTDQKKYVRNKAVRNLELKNKAFNPVYKLSAYEAAVLNLIGTKKMPVDDVPVNKSGILNPKTDKQVDENKKSENTPKLSKAVTTTNRSNEDHKKEKKVILAAEKELDNRKILTSPLEEKESKPIHECFGNMSETIAELKQEYTGVAASVEKIYQSLVQSNDFRNELLKETIRHNNEMEKMRQREIEIKHEKSRQVIKIEELKLKILQKKQ